LLSIPSPGVPESLAAKFLAHGEVKSALLIPLVSRGQRLGVLVLGSRLRDLMDSDWRPFAQTIGAQISQTIALGQTFSRLAAAEEKYRGLFENAAEGIFRTSPDGRLLLANPAVARILGYDSLEDLMARVADVARDVYSDPVQRDELLRRMAEDGVVTGFEIAARRKDGGTVWLSLSARVVRVDGALQYFEGRVEDVTARKHAEEMATALGEVGRELVITVDFAQVAERVVSTVARVFRVRRAGLYRLDPGSASLTCVAVSGEDSRAWLGQVLPLGVAAAGRAAAEGRAVTSSDIATDSATPLPDWVVERVRAENLGAGAGAALIVRGKILGALGLGDRAGRAFTDEELRLLSAFADQAAIALANAQLYAEAERRRRAAEGLADLGRLVSRSLDPAEVRQRVVEGVRELLGSRSASLMRIDEGSGTLVTMAVSGELAGVLAGGRSFPVRSGASGRAVTDRRPVITTDILADKRIEFTAEDRALFEPVSCRAVLAVPLTVHERVIGALNVAGLTGRVFDEEEIRLVQAFADQAAVALENARLFEETTSAHDFLRSIAANSADAIITADSKGHVTYFSPGAEEMLGYAAGEVLGLPVADLYEAGLPEARVVMRRLRAEQRLRGYGSVFRARDGRGIEASASISLLRDAAGTVVGSLGVLRDVTEQRRAEEALRESEERFRRAFDDSSIGMALQTIDGWYVRANRAYCELVGYTAEELLRMGFREIVHPEDQDVDVEPDRRLIAGELSGHQREKRYRHKDGRVLWVLSSVSLVRNHEGRQQHLLVQVQNLTERKRMEEELDRQREARLQSDKLAAMGQLLAGVAHELNNPLSVVMGRAELLTRALAGGPLGPRVEKLAQAAERCARIVKNFLALARQRPPERETVHLNRIVQEAIELLGYPLRTDSVQVELDLAPDLPALWADAHQLHQVVVNLVTNAHQAMREQTGLRRLTLTTRRDAAGQVVLEAADTGPGIRAEVLPRLFEPFFTTKPPGQGTGLGLSLCRGIVEEHGGSISVESAVGQGARFRIELPVTAPAGEATAPAVAPPPAAGGRSIVVVDDEADVAAVLAEMLEQDGHVVDVVNNGQLALERIQEKRYDLVFSDMRMPVLDGPGLYRRLTALGHPLARRFIFLTGDVLGPETRAFLERSGALSVTKPFAVAEIRRAVEQALQPPGPEGKPR
jgi:two-component system NtrC family sensor kinase